MFDKLDAYNIVANLIPGAALTYALHTSDFPTPAPESIAGFLLFSFVVGVTSNRLGSLLLDPLLRKLRFLRHKDYASFVTLEKEDKKLEVLVANAGLYRTFLTTGAVYFILHGLNVAADEIGLSANGKLASLLAIGMLVFLFALRKEDGYIDTRIAEARPKSSS